MIPVLGRVLGDAASIHSQQIIAFICSRTTQQLHRGILNLRLQDVLTQTVGSYGPHGTFTSFICYFSPLAKRLDSGFQETGGSTTVKYIDPTTNTLWIKNYHIRKRDGINR